LRGQGELESRRAELVVEFLGRGGIAATPPHHPPVRGLWEHYKLSQWDPPRVLVHLGFFK